MADASALTPERVSLTRLLWVGPLTIIAAVVANVAFVTVTNPLFGVPPDFPALTREAVAAFTAVGVLLAVVVFALVARFARRPISLYRRIAIVALMLSFIPDLALLLIPGPIPVRVREVVLLMATHVVAAAVTIGLLSSLTREPPASELTEA
jgi:Family of unknown function (DUF6069)